MRKKLLLLLFIFNVVLLQAQNIEKVKKERRIYLWDVTLSMQGGAGCRNIWNDVKINLIKNIDGIMDPETEIVLLPFQHRIIGSTMVTATASGKNELKNFITNYELPRLWVGKSPITGHEAQPGEKGNTTMTKLYAPIIQCVNSYISKDRTNVLIIMTDGVSDFEDDRDKFYELIDNEWCDLAKANNIYAFYFMLTPNAIIERLKDNPPCRMEPIQPEKPEIKNFMLTPDNTVCYNVKDDFNKPITIHFKNNTSDKMEKNYKIHVKTESNCYFEIDDEYELNHDDLSILIQPKLKFNNAEDMRRAILDNMNNGSNITVQLSYEKGKGMENINYPITISDCKTNIEFIVKKERKITLDWINE